MLQCRCERVWALGRFHYHRAGGGNAGYTAINDEREERDLVITHTLEKLLLAQRGIDIIVSVERIRREAIVPH